MRGELSDSAAAITMPAPAANHGVTRSPRMRRAGRAGRRSWGNGRVDGSGRAGPVPEPFASGLDSGAIRFVWVAAFSWLWPLEFSSGRRALCFGMFPWR